jgi:hypothetical protein
MHKEVSRNLCYKPNQQNQVNEHQCKEMEDNTRRICLIAKESKYKNCLDNAHPAQYTTSSKVSGHPSVVLN